MKKVRWKNFLSTGNVWTEVDLVSSPMTLIVGENGAGKSTILDALCYGLFGKSFRKINKDQLNNSINRREMLVEIEFSIGKNEYLVRRGRHPTVFEIYLDDRLVDQTSAREYQEHLEKNIIKLNYVSFTQIVILGSSNFVPFMQLSAWQRRGVVEDLLDIKIFSSMNVLLKEKIQINKDKLTNLKYQIDLAEEKITLHRQHIEELKNTNEKRVADITVELEEKQKELNRLNHAIEEANEKVGRLTSEIRDATNVEKKSKELKQLREKLNNKIEKIAKQKDFYENTIECPTCTQVIDEQIRSELIRANEDKIVEVEEAMLQLSQTLVETEKRTVEILSVQSSITQLLEEINSYQNNSNSIQTHIDILKKDLEKISGEDVDVSSTNVRIKELETEIMEIEFQREVAIHEKEVLEMAAELLKDKGIKTQIVKQYVPVMNKLINKYLAAMEFFVKFELDENFNEVIKSRHRDDFSYDSFSEGEKKRLDLALLLTWRAIAKMKNSTNTNLLVLDEVFDASLDAAGCEEFMNVLASESFKDVNVFIITHSQNINSDRFKNIIRFEKHKNFSRIAA